MQRTGYRNCFKDGLHFRIKSDISQFNFSLLHDHLNIPINWSTKNQLAPIERVNIYFKGNLLLRNVFVVNEDLFYYYERDWYYGKGEDPRADVPIPKLNILARFKFSIEDIVLIQANNVVTRAKFNWFQRIFEPDYDSMDNLRNIKHNIFVKEEGWTVLPKIDSDTLYHL